jgi:hypothetical protein
MEELELRMSAENENRKTPEQVQSLEHREEQGA